MPSASDATDDDVNIELWWDVSADLIEELSELDRAVAGKALADDVASGLVQGREERRRPVALVLGRAPRGFIGWVRFSAWIAHDVGKGRAQR